MADSFSMRFLEISYMICSEASVNLFEFKFIFLIFYVNSRLFWPGYVFIDHNQFPPVVHNTQCHTAQ